jgi:SAM-dependent methyltransferase
MDWFEDDRFWVEFGPMLFTAQRAQATPAEVEGFVRLAGLTTGSEVLDLCCGPGRHSLALAARGMRVTALDRTRAYLDQLSLTAKTQELDLTVVEQDMRGDLGASRYDAILNAFTSFGYFDDPADDLHVLQAALRALKPGGTLVMDILGKEVLARGWQERFWTWLPDGRLLLEERVVERDWGWVRNHWTVLKGAERKDYELRHRLYSGAELRALLQEAGFETVALFGGLDGSAYDRQAWRLVAVATAPR